ncbi:hypothetical protein CQW23_02140 [Capsicum baccatum]|uniref:Uncharacterized protein n=1 Tax=Capsicum baccatum TaxID=33114 RepID=A0A2G2XQK4_CAPBA|nr:hypothetical protein CQW23_02140 [Capsicum baccatum]
MESEFIALDKDGEEAEWLQNFLEDITYWPKPVAPICIHCDSQAAISWAGSIMYNGKSRHIRWRYNTVRKLLSSGIITVDYVKLKDNVSDPLTKGLSREVVERTSRGMGLSPRTSQHGVHHCKASMWCISSVGLDDKEASSESIPFPSKSTYVDPSSLITLTQRVAFSDFGSCVEEHLDLQFRLMHRGAFWLAV